MTSSSVSVESLLHDNARLREALQEACFALVRRGDVAGVVHCLNAGISPDLINDEGNTLLTLAMYHWKYQVATLLIDRGANVQAPYHQDHGFIARTTVGNERYVQERCPELLVAYRQALQRDNAERQEAVHS